MVLTAICYEWINNVREALKDNTLTSVKIELSETSQKIERDHNSTPVIEKNPIDRKFDIAGKKSNFVRATCECELWNFLCR